MKFLHIADVHLGCTRYNLPESPRDFYDAWIDVIRRYAIDERVDFVIMCGDFFHKRTVPPETMNYAVDGLTELRNAGIPVISIEGNHDQKHTDSEYSWLRSLANWGLLKLLESTAVDGETVYEAWNEETKKGGFIDVGQARIFGSEWYGASGNWKIPTLIEAISQNRRDGAFHILMLHTDVEGHQTHPIPALSLDALKQLKSVTNYVGLGHTHKYYEIDNWAFNPGSIEITNISEYRENRGVFLVDVDENNVVSPRHLTEYHHRPFQRLQFEVSNCETPVQVTAGAIETIENTARRAEADKPRPIIEIELRGRLGFPNSALELAKIRNDALKITGALHVRIKNHTVPVDFLERPIAEEEPRREALERRVIEDLVLHDNRFRTRVSDISEAVVGAKRMALFDEEPGKIAEFIAAKTFGAAEAKIN